MKLDFYTICPKHYVEAVKDYRFHLVVAQWLREKDYRVQMKVLRAQDHKFILDNGAYEFGEAMPDEEYWKIIGEFKPQIVVAPDIYRDGPGTIDRTEAFIKEMTDRYMELRFEVMGVPQGKTLTDWMKCYETMASMVDVIGLPMGQWYDESGIVRSFLAKNIDALKSPRIHLLGLWNIAELDMYKEIPRVKSIDTSFPFKQAAFEEFIGEYHMISSLKLDWNLAYSEKIIKYAEANLKRMKERCDNA
jgi:hypothetical protein